MLVEMDVLTELCLKMGECRSGCRIAGVMVAFCTCIESPIRTNPYNYVLNLDILR